jgi:phage protein D
MTLVKVRIGYGGHNLVSFGTFPVPLTHVSMIGKELIVPTMMLTSAL